MSTEASIVTSTHRNASWLFAVLLFPLAMAMLWLQYRGAATGAVAADAGMTVSMLFVTVTVASRTTREYEVTPRWLFFAAAVGAATGIIAWRIMMQPIEAVWNFRAPQFLDEVKASRAFRGLMYAAVGAAAGLLPLMRARLSELEEAVARAQDSATLHRDAELFKLRQQFGPHFLYNSLNSVSALVSIAPDKAQEMVGRLAHFMRASVRRESAERVPLADELGYLQEYLAIEAVRFGDRLAVRIADGGGCDDCDIPPFLLQPLLENAIKYGVYGTTGAVEISVDISRVPGALRIVITNPFDPLTAPPSGTGFGLTGVGRRLTLLYGRTDLLQTSRAPSAPLGAGSTFTTTLTIPQSRG